MFSSISEAFDNPIKEQMNNYNLGNDNYQSFINTQGDITNKHDVYQGTSLKSLENIQKEAMDEFENDTLYTDSFDMSDTIQKPQHSHQYYITNFLKTLNVNDDASDMESLFSSTDRDSEIMKHIRSCNYCRNSITNKINNDANTYYTEKPPAKKKNNFSILNKKLGYEFREIVIIILVGILVIFILDMFFRFSQKVSNIRP